jgi:hypothetical protein
MKYGGHLEISSASYERFREVQEVDGDLTILRDAKRQGEAAGAMIA